jgi:hypothetical protein
MSKSTPSKQKLHSDRALLCLLGQKAQELQLLDPLHQLVKIDQKTLLHSPTEKLVDALLAIACGAQALSQINTVLKADPAISRAWGRTRCADQSTVQETLSACTAQNIEQMQQALGQIYRARGRALNHDYTTGPLILDIDLTGLPCSKNYAGSTKGYFANAKRGTTGRQLCRVNASQYDEIVYQKVCPGNASSAELGLLQTVLQASLEMLGLNATQAQKGQLLIRLDGGFGTTAILQYLLAEGYQFIVKLHSASRSKKWGQAVAESQWLGDPNSTGLRWASRLDEAANQLYAIPNHAEGETEAAAARVSPAKLQLIAVRCKRVEVVELKAKAKAKAKSEYVYSVLAVCRTARESENAVNTSTSTEEVTLASSLAQLALYDERATIESASFRGDKQGLKLIKRRKASLYGQEMLILLAQLVHNLVVWARNWLSEYEPRLAEFGIKVWVRDLFRLPGRVKFKGGRIVKVQLRRGHQYARRFFYAFYHFFAKSEIRLILDEV